MTKRTAVASVLAVAGAVGVAVWLAKAGSTTLSYTFPVPARVQRAIVRDYRQLAYLPTRLPSGLHYTSFDGVRGFEFTLSFSKPGSASDELEYRVVAADCAGQGTPMQSFTLNGVDVSWSGLYTEQHAWRCVTANGTSLVIQVSRSVAGDANPGAPVTPRIRRHALQLAEVVASAKPAASP